MHNGVSVVDDSAKADIFNNYFYSVFFMQEDFNNLNSLGVSLEHQPSVISTVTFSPSTMCSYLKSLDGSKACGPDLLPAFLLICCVEESLFHCHTYLIDL